MLIDFSHLDIDPYHRCGNDNRNIPDEAYRKVSQYEDRELYRYSHSSGTA